MAKLTEEEHTARAMLMGMEYLDWASAYMGEDHNPWPVPDIVWLDADTMEPLDLDEVSRRIQKTLEDDPSANLGLEWGKDMGEKS